MLPMLADLLHRGARNQPSCAGIPRLPPLRQAQGRPYAKNANDGAPCGVADGKLKTWTTRPSFVVAQG